MHGCYMYKVRSYLLASPIQLRVNDMHYGECNVGKYRILCLLKNTIDS